VPIISSRERAKERKKKRWKEPRKEKAGPTGQNGEREVGRGLLKMRGIPAMLGIRVGQDWPVPAGGGGGVITIRAVASNQRIGARGNRGGEGKKVGASSPGVIVGGKGK